MRKEDNELLVRVGPGTAMGEVFRFPYARLGHLPEGLAALRDRGVDVEYIVADDEGHGFAKKRNQDFQFQSTVLFLRDHLLGNATTPPLR